MQSSICACLFVLTVGMVSADDTVVTTPASSNPFNKVGKSFVDRYAELKNFYASNYADLYKIVNDTTQYLQTINQYIADLTAGAAGNTELISALQKVPVNLQKVVNIQTQLPSQENQFNTVNGLWNTTIASVYNDGLSTVMNANRAINGVGQFLVSRWGLILSVAASIMAFMIVQ